MNVPIPDAVPVNVVSEASVIAVADLTFILAPELTVIIPDVPIEKLVLAFISIEPPVVIAVISLFAVNE